jgi:hypothetical protein
MWLLAGCLELSAVLLERRNGGNLCIISQKERVSSVSVSAEFKRGEASKYVLRQRTTNSEGQTQTQRTVLTNRRTSIPNPQKLREVQRRVERALVGGIAKVYGWSFHGIRVRGTGRIDHKVHWQEARYT